MDEKPADSQNVRTLQATITRSVANTAATNTSNAIDGGINMGFSDSGTPTNLGPSGGFINFAEAPKSQTASRAEEAFPVLNYAGVKKAPA